MKHLLIVLLLFAVAFTMMSCEYQQGPPPPESMEKVVIVSIIDSDCCRHVTKAKRLKSNTMASLEVVKSFQVGDTLLVPTKSLKIR